METSSSEEDLQNVEEPGTSTSSATTHNSRKGKSKSSSKQPAVKRSKRQQSFFAGKSLSKNKLSCKNAVARIYGSCKKLLDVTPTRTYKSLVNALKKRAVAARGYEFYLLVLTVSLTRSLRSLLRDIFSTRR